LVLLNQGKKSEKETIHLVISKKDKKQKEGKNVFFSFSSAETSDDTPLTSILMASPLE
jgi:hypothetical protein